MTKPKRERKLYIGKTYEVKTFAGVKVYSKITSVCDEEKRIYMGVLLRDEDVASLRNAGVPYEKDAKPCECEGAVYSFQVIREIRKTKGATHKKKGSKGGKRRIVR